MRKIEIVTSRSGGPLAWGRDLAQILLTRDDYQAHHSHSIMEIAALAVKKYHILHSTLPLNNFLKRGKNILTVHGNYKKENNFWSQYYDGAIKAASFVTVPSEYLKNELNINNAAVIPNAVFVDNFNQIFPQKNEKIKLLTATNFHFPEKAKGIDDLINIIGDIKFCENIEFNILGEGKYLDEIKQKNRKKRELDINFLGFQNTRDYLKESDIFVYCSYLDNMPFAILEAMACGMPVVSNDVGAVKEIINNGVDGIIANDRFDFGQKLTNLINDFDSRVTIGQRARETIKSSYDWKVVIEKYKTIYEHLL